MIILTNPKFWTGVIFAVIALTGIHTMEVINDRDISVSGKNKHRDKENSYEFNSKKKVS